MALDGDEYVIHIRPAVNSAEFRAATDIALDAVEHEFAESGAESGRRFAAAARRNAALGLRGMGVGVGGAGIPVGGLGNNILGPAGINSIMAGQMSAVDRVSGIAGLRAAGFGGSGLGNTILGPAGINSIMAGQMAAVDRVSGLAGLRAAGLGSVGNTILGPGTLNAVMASRMAANQRMAGSILERWPEFPDDDMPSRNRMRMGSYAEDPRVPIMTRMRRGSEVNTGFGQTGRRGPWARHGPGWQFASGAGPPGSYAQRAGFAGLFGGPWGVAGVATGGAGFAAVKGYQYHSEVEAAERRSLQLFGTEFKELTTITEKWTDALGASKHELYGVYEGLLQALLPIADSREEAEKYSFALGELASKLALFKNADVIQVGRAIQRATVGEFENLKTYGIPVTRNQITGDDGRPLPVGSAEYVRALLPILESYAGPANLYQPPESQQTVRGLGASWKRFAASFGATVGPIVGPMLRGLSSGLDFFAPEDQSVTSAGLDWDQIRSLLAGDQMEPGDLHSAIASRAPFTPVGGYRQGPGYFRKDSGFDRATAEQALLQIQDTMGLHKQYFGHSTLSRAGDKFREAMSLGFFDTKKTDQRQALTDAMSELGLPSSPGQMGTLEGIEERLIQALEDLTLVEEQRRDDEVQAGRVRSELDWQESKQRLTFPERRFLAEQEAREARMLEARATGISHYQTVLANKQTYRYDLWEAGKRNESFQDQGRDYAQSILMNAYGRRLSTLDRNVGIQRRIANEQVGVYGSHTAYNEMARQLKELGPGAATTYGEEKDVARGSVVQQMFGLINALPDEMRGTYLADLPKDLKQLGIETSSSIDKYISRAGAAISEEDKLQRQADLMEQAMKNALAWFEDQLPADERNVRSLIRATANRAVNEPNVFSDAGPSLTDALAQAVVLGFEIVRDRYYDDVFPSVPPNISQSTGSAGIAYTDLGH